MKNNLFPIQYLGFPLPMYNELLNIRFLCNVPTLFKGFPLILGIHLNINGRIVVISNSVFSHDINNVLVIHSEQSQPHHDTMC